MSVLHIISSIEASARLQFVSSDDTILLCDDGCFAHRQMGAHNAAVMMLQACAEGRGIQPNDEIQLISDADWVKLTISAKTSITW